jgi:outer membrane lipoprotein SlyB
MKRTMILAGLAAMTLSACRSAESAQAERARDLQLALQEQQLRNRQVVSPGELGLPQQQGQWVYVPQGQAPPPGSYVQPAPVPVAPAPAPRVVYRTASVGRASAPAPARAPQRVTHTKRDAVIGAAAGAVTGAVIGRNVKGAVIGAAAGGVLGAIVGSTVDVDHR